MPACPFAPSSVWHRKTCLSSYYTEYWRILTKWGNQLFDFCLLLSALPVLDICCWIKAWNPWPCKNRSAYQVQIFISGINYWELIHRNNIRRRGRTCGGRWWPGYASTRSRGVCTSSSFHRPLSSILCTFSRSRASPDCPVPRPSLPRKGAINFSIYPWADTTRHRSHSAAYTRKTARVFSGWLIWVLKF